jgi:TetR/AcrR family transcriptional repressor of nem operon
MGRSKQYDRTELLDRAVELFRMQGFNGTSTAELVEELGVNRKSMYAEFGSKQELFEAALDHYDRNHLTRVLAPIEAADSGVDAIREAFARYATSSEGWFRGRGCLMCNTAVERGALDPAIGRFASAYLDRINRAFRHALENGRKAGDLDETTDLDEMAALLTTLLIGVAASIRAEAPTAQLHATSRMVSSILDMNRPIIRL